MNWLETQEEDDATVECNHCGREIYEDAEQCPYCQSYQTDEEKHSSSQPKWVILTAVFLLALFAISIVLQLL